MLCRHKMSNLWSSQRTSCSACWTVPNKNWASQTGKGKAIMFLSFVFFTTMCWFNRNKCCGPIVNQGIQSTTVSEKKDSHRETWLLIGCFTGIDPVAVNVHWLGQIGYWGLELLQTHTAWYNPRVACSFHFDITRFLMVTKRAGELGVQVTSHFFLRRGLSLRLSATHFTLLYLQNKKNVKNYITHHYFATEKCISLHVAVHPSNG